MDIFKKPVFWMAAGALLWFVVRKGKAMKWSDASGQTYQVSQAQRDMLAAQDAAFSAGAEYETAPFHGYGANATEA